MIGYLIGRHVLGVAASLTPLALAPVPAHATPTQVAPAHATHPHAAPTQVAPAHATPAHVAHATHPHPTHVHATAAQATHAHVAHVDAGRAAAPEPARKPGRDANRHRRAEAAHRGGHERRRNTSADFVRLYRTARPLDDTPPGDLPADDLPADGDLARAADGTVGSADGTVIGPTDGTVMGPARADKARRRQDKAADVPPATLRIPSLNLGARIIRVGMEKGRIAAPPLNDTGKVGWFEGGPKPGAQGAAVILGHYDTATGPSIFYKIDQLEPGHRIYVTRKDGERLRFLVTKVSTYPKDDFPASKVYGDPGYPALRLITCGGAFNTTTRHYVDNTVVFAKLVGGGGAA
ncbi:class F sortase [Nonomuraea sp. NPDC059194]|uniref:class F sortase n=1 Tax=Nonomuraea sp. NPDC059194 TaxID=3346764 RepID=UPI0036B73F67